MNKKGTTLVELIISIALTSIVLIFMVKLIVDVNNYETNSDYAKKDQLIRTEIIRTIENDLIGKTVSKITRSGNNITIVTNEKTLTITLTGSNVLKYSNGSKTRKWTFEDGILVTPKIVENNGENGFYTIIITYEVHTINDNNTKDETATGKTGTKYIKTQNNPIDDIIIPYIGKGSISIS